jgi:dihydroneopterin aldolase
MIDIEGITVFAHHGVLPEEKEKGQPFIIDVRLELAAPPAGDYLAATVDYAEVVSRIAEIATADTYDLIETLASKIADSMLEHERVRKTSVTVSKPEAPMPLAVSRVGVTVSKARSGTRGYFTGSEEP